MKSLVRLLALLLIAWINFLACHSGEATSTSNSYNTSQKGVVKTMKTYYLGRFALDVPIEMKQAVQAQSIRGTEVEEFLWSIEDERVHARVQVWQSRIARIKQLELPRKAKKHIIEEAVDK